MSKLTIILFVLMLMVVQNGCGNDSDDTRKSAEPRLVKIELGSNLQEIRGGRGKMPSYYVTGCFLVNIEYQASTKGGIFSHDDFKGGNVVFINDALPPVQVKLKVIGNNSDARCPAGCSQRIAAILFVDNKEADTAEADCNHPDELLASW